MAIKYTTQQTKEIFEIGSGFDNQGEAEQIVAPFPNYSISREPVLTPDGTLLNNKYTISITGKILASALTDITVDGEKQNNIQRQLIWHLKLKRSGNVDHNIGRLEIEPYGGLANKYIFEDARLTGFNIPEQPEDSSGVLYADYSLTFDAYKDSSVDNSGSSICNKVVSFEESWEVSEIDGQGAILTAKKEDFAAPYKVYNISHNISAVGIKSIENNGNEVRLAWKNAADFVKTRLTDSPASILINDVSGNSSDIVKTFDPRVMGYDQEDKEIFGPDLSKQAFAFESATPVVYNFYSHTRVPRCDFAGGSYSVTETWVASNCPFPATVDSNIETSVDDSGQITMTLSGTINGLSSNQLNSNKIDTKLTNAENMLALIDEKAYELVKTYYAKYPTTEVQGDTDLQNVIRSKSIGRNRFTGVITFSYSYNDSKIIVPNALSNSLSITYDNDSGDVDIIAIIPIIGRKEGPIIQNMATTKERRRSLTLDAVMSKKFRVNKPNIAYITDAYRPSETAKVQSWNESWNPLTGSYSLSIEWVA